MKNKYRYMIAAWILASIGIHAVLNFAQVPAPEPAVGNLIMEDWKNRQGTFVGQTDSLKLPSYCHEGDTVGMVPPRFIYPVWQSDGNEYVPKNDWKTEFIDLWQQYKAEFKPIVWSESMFIDSTGHIEYQHELTEPTAEGFFDWLEGRVK